MSVQCQICGKILRGPSQLRIHSQIHSSSPPMTTVQTPSQITYSPSPQPVKASALEQMKKNIADQNEMMMLLSTNKMLRDSLQGNQPNVQQPNNFTEVRNLLKDIKSEILEEIDQQPESDEDPVSRMAEQLILSKLQGGGQHDTSTPSISNIQAQATENDFTQEINSYLEQGVQPEHGGIERNPQISSEPRVLNEQPPSHN